MSTLAEIEAAVETLPPSERQKLMAFLAGTTTEPAVPAPVSTEDPFEAVIGAFSSGRREATGRNAEEILYGKTE